MSVLPCDLLVEGWVKIGEVCEFSEKSVRDKSDCDEHVDELVMDEFGELGGLNCSSSAWVGCFRILLLMISRYVFNHVSSWRIEDSFSMWSSKVG